jgi:hypothetical protein
MPLSSTYRAPGITPASAREPCTGTKSPRRCCRSVGTVMLAATGAWAKDAWVGLRRHGPGILPQMSEPAGPHAAPAGLPLPGGSADAAVRVRPLLCGVLTSPPGWFHRAEGR